MMIMMTRLAGLSGDSSHHRLTFNSLNVSLHLSYNPGTHYMTRAARVLITVLFLFCVPSSAITVSPSPSFSPTRTTSFAPTSNTASPTVSPTETTSLTPSSTASPSPTPSPTQSSSLTPTPSLTQSSTATAAADYVATALAGGGVLGNTSGSADGTGTNALFKSPNGVAVDALGTVYVADTLNNKVRSITPLGNVSTLAGGGVGANNGIGTNAGFSTPAGIAVNATGSIFVADWVNNKIRLILPNGTVSTLVGGGADGISRGAANGVGTNALFDSPADVAVDALGNVYVADFMNSLIRLVSGGSVVSTIAGGGVGGTTSGANDGVGTNAAFSNPIGISVDAAGNLYVADSSNHKLRFIAPGGLVSTLSGGGVGGATGGRNNGVGTNALFMYPRGIAVDAAGSVFVADDGNHLVRLITADGAVSTVAGGGAGGASSGSIDGVGTNALFNSPYGVAVDASGNVYIADLVSCKISVLVPLSSPSTTPSPSQTTSPSRTASATESPTSTGSATSTTTISMSGTMSLSLSSTPSMTATLSLGASPSRSLTVTTTTSGTPSYSPSRTASATESPTSRGSATSTTTISMSGTMSLSLSSTPSMTATLSFGASPSRSLTVTTTTSGTPSYSPSPTPTPSSTPPACPAGTYSGAIGATSNATCAACPNGTIAAVGSTSVDNCTNSSILTSAATSSGTLTPSSTASSSQTSSLTTSETPTASPPITASESPTATPSTTTSETPTTSDSPDGTTSGTASPSQTSSPTSSETSSATQTATVTPSITSTATSTPSTTGPPTSSATGTPSRSAVPTPSATTSRTATPAPRSCGASPMNCAFARFANAPVRLLLSPAANATLGGLNAAPLPPFRAAVLQLSLPVAPTAGERVSIVCSADSRAVRVTVGAAVVDGGGDAGVSVPVNVLALVTKPAIAANEFATLRCTVASTTVGELGSLFPRYPPSYLVTLPLLVVRPSYPLLTDALFETNATWTSAWGSTATSLLAPLASDGSRASPEPGVHASAWTAADVSAADKARVVSLARLTTSSPAKFSRTLFGATHIVFVAARNSSSTWLGGPPFSNASVVSVGAARARVNWVSDDGYALSVLTPTSAQACADNAAATSSCGNVIVSIAPPAAAAAFASKLAALVRDDDVTAELTADAARAGLLGMGTAVCPPACPGAWDLADATPGPAELSAEAAAVAAASLDEGGAGFFESSQCDPVVFNVTDTSTCTNPGDALSRRCAYGADDTCRVCPEGALCPGGNRIWPLPGWWAASESAIDTLEICEAPPGLTRADRCPGAPLTRLLSFDDGARRGVSASSALGFPCGVGFRTGSVRCAGCAAGYFPESSGACTPCPSSDAFNGVAVPALKLAAALTAIFVSLTLLSWQLSKRQGGTRTAAVFRAWSFVVWLFGSMQVIVQVARTMPAQTPPFLRRFIEPIVTLQFQGIAVDPACMDAAPFQGAVLQFWVLFTLVLFTAAAVWTRHRVKRAVKLQRAGLLRSSSMSRLTTSAASYVAPSLTFLAPYALTVLDTLYATFTNTALSVLTCTTTTVSVRSYIQLSGADGSSLAAGAAALGAAASKDAVLANAVRAALSENGGESGFGALRSYVVGSAGTGAVPSSLRAVLQSLLAARVSVQTLASDPFTVCWEGAHVNVASGASAVIALFSIGFPLVTAFIVAAVLDVRMKNPKIVGHISSTRWRAFGGIKSVFCRCQRLSSARARTGALTSAPSTHTEETGVLQLNPLRGAPPSSPSTGAARKLVDAQSAAALLDASPEASHFRMVSTWVFENTKPSLFYLPMLNNLFLLVLAVTVAYQLGTSAGVLSTTAEQLRRSLLVWSVAVVVAVLGAAMHFKLERFTGTDRWRNSAVASIYLLMGLGNTVNLCAYLESRSALSDGRATIAMAAVLVLVAAGMICALVAYFFRSLYEGAAEEQKQIVAAANKAARAAAPASHARAQDFDLDDNGAAMRLGVTFGVNPIARTTATIDFDDFVPDDFGAEARLSKSGGFNPMNRGVPQPSKKLDAAAWPGEDAVGARLEGVLDVLNPLARKIVPNQDNALDNSASSHGASVGVDPIARSPVDFDGILPDDSGAEARLSNSGGFNPMNHGALDDALNPLAQVPAFPLTARGEVASTDAARHSHRLKRKHHHQTALNSATAKSNAAAFLRAMRVSAMTETEAALMLQRAWRRLRLTKIEHFGRKIAIYEKS